MAMASSPTRLKNVCLSPPSPYLFNNETTQASVCIHNGAVAEPTWWAIQIGSGQCSKEDLIERQIRPFTGIESVELSPCRYVSWLEVAASRAQTQLNMEISSVCFVCSGVVSTSWFSVAMTGTPWCLFPSICAGEFRIPCHAVSSKRKQQIISPSLKQQDRQRGGWGWKYLLKSMISAWLTDTEPLLQVPCVQRTRHKKLWSRNYLILRAYLVYCERI